MTCKRCEKAQVIKGRRICSKCKYTEEKQKDPFGLAYRRLKAHAKYRGKDFTLTREQFDDFCVKSEYTRGSGIFKNSLHIDRIDESKGYSIENIQVLSNSENVKKYCKWIDRDESGKNTFKVIRDPEPDFQHVPF